MNSILYWCFSMMILLSCRSADHKPATIKEPEVFESKYVRLASDTNHLMMIEKVVVRFGDLYAEADSAFLEKPKKTITLYAVRNLVFQDKQMQPTITQTIKYTKGDKELRIN